MYREIALATVALLVLAACGGDDDDTTSTTPDTSESSESTEPDSTEPAPTSTAAPTTVPDTTPETTTTSTTTTTTTTLPPVGTSLDDLAEMGNPDHDLLDWGHNGRFDIHLAGVVEVAGTDDNLSCLAVLGTEALLEPRENALTAGRLDGPLPRVVIDGEVDFGAHVIVSRCDVTELESRGWAELSAHTILAGGTYDYFSLFSVESGDVDAILLGSEADGRYYAPALLAEVPDAPGRVIAELPADVRPLSESADDTVSFETDRDSWEVAVLGIIDLPEKDRAPEGYDCIAVWSVLRPTETAATVAHSLSSPTIELIVDGLVLDRPDPVCDTDRIQQGGWQDSFYSAVAAGTPVGTHWDFLVPDGATVSGIVVSDGVNLRGGGQYTLFEPAPVPELVQPPRPGEGVNPDLETHPVGSGDASTFEIGGLSQVTWTGQIDAVVELVGEDDARCLGVVGHIAADDPDGQFPPDVYAIASGHLYGEALFSFFGPCDREPFEDAGWIRANRPPDEVTEPWPVYWLMQVHPEVDLAAIVVGSPSSIENVAFFEPDTVDAIPTP